MKAQFLCVFFPVLLLFLLCLSCPAFPLKYAKYLESYSVEGVRHIYKKACTIHMPKKPTVHLLWAAFEEQQGKDEHHVLDLMPSYVFKHHF